MSFDKFEWTDRLVEYPNRKRIIDTVTQSETVVDVYRNEGIIQVEGSKLSAKNMNNLEKRIANMFPVSIENIKKSDLLNYIYPVGSIYISISENNPNIFFGGKWEQIRDRFLLSSSNTYPVGTIGGESAHTLTESEMPIHSHKINESTEKRWSSEDGDWATFKCGTSNTIGGDIYTQNAGNNQAHNNMPPYLSVYMWKRIS